MRASRLSPAGNAQYTLPLVNWTFPNESMVLGENGVAFATDAQQVILFNVADGTVNWMWQPASGQARLGVSLEANRLMVRVVDYVQQSEDIVSIDNAGLATLTSLSGQSLQLAPGDVAYSLGSTSQKKAPAVRWGESTWPEASGGQIRAAENFITVRVYSISEAHVDPVFVRSRVNEAIFYWLLMARIHLKWDQVIQPEPRCQNLPGRPCNVNSKEDLFNINLDGVPELVRRFLKPTGIDIVFTEAITGIFVGPIHINARAATVPGKNLIAIGEQAEEDVLTHEFGHVLGLPHVPNYLPPTFPDSDDYYNLMCGSVGALDVIVLCSSPPGPNLNESQIRDARRGARRLL